MEKYFAQFLTYANRNLGLADEEGSANIVEIYTAGIFNVSQWLTVTGRIVSKFNSQAALLR